MLRQNLTVTLGTPPNARQAVVREITPLQAQKLHSAVLGFLDETAENVTAQELADLMVGDAALKLELLQECSDLGQEVHELGAGAFLQLWEAFEEVNTPFLERLAGMLRAGAAVTEAVETGEPPMNQTT